MAVLDFTLSAIRTKQSLEPSKLRRGLIDAFSIVVNVVGFGIVFLLAAAWFFMDLKKGIYGGLVYGIAFGLVVAVRGRNRTLIEDIDRAQEVGWSLLGSVRGFFLGFAVAAILSLSSGLVISVISGRTLALRLGIVVSLSGAIVGAIVFGLRRVSVEEVGVASEGVSQWAKNTLMVSLYVGLPLILLFWFYTGRYIESHRAALETGLFFGLVVGMLAGCLFGGLDLIYHFVLRFLLRLNGFPTVRFATFLASSTHLAFLREVGGSYEFRHLSLRDHFAELSDTDKQTINTNLDGGNTSSVIPDVANRSERMQGPRTPQPLCEAIR